MRITTGELRDDKAVKTFYFLWHRHEWATVNVKGHLEDVTKT